MPGIEKNIAEREMEICEVNWGKFIPVELAIGMTVGGNAN
jgi:hypothetical protein